MMSDLAHADGSTRPQRSTVYALLHRKPDDIPVHLFTAEATSAKKLAKKGLKAAEKALLDAQKAVEDASTV